MLAHIKHILAFSFLALCGHIQAQEIHGEILDISNGEPIQGVYINNIHNGAVDTSMDDGKFVIAAGNGNLIEFRKEGYKVARARMPEGIMPKYFRIILEHERIIAVAKGRAETYEEDSLKYYEFYRHYLEFPRMNTLDKIQHPFSAMSKTNQQIWAFQDEYHWFQQQKYIDYHFNEDVIAHVTGMKQQDSVEQYIFMFRPTYEQLREMTDYQRYEYIRSTVDLYRKRGIRARTPRDRLSD